MAIEQILTLDELYNLLDDSSKIDIKVRNACEKLVEAERDWRTSPESIEAFIYEVEEMIGGKSTKENIKKLISKYEPFALNYAWELESLTTMLEVFDYDKNKSLREIFVSICSDLKK